MRISEFGVMSNRGYLWDRYNTQVFFSEAPSSGARKSKAEGSARTGTRPRRCARTSSWITDVLFTMKMCSIAIVGI